tara:strand:- start:6839 stop:7972 length:1134 start_codon:yes stop_codon:yes gene_type:complete
VSYAAPFDKLRVVDLSQGIAGPYCAMLLAQYGADVIKVEPADGDWARHIGETHGDHTPFSVAGNLGKRSLVLDLKDPDDQEVLWDYLDGADLFIEGFRPGVCERLGFGYEAVQARNSRLIYVSVSGFGQTGPLASKPAMDPILQAFTGYMASNCMPDGTPMRTPPIIVDMSTALYAFQAVSAALYARRDEQEGRRIEVSLMEAAINLQCVRQMQTHLVGAQPPSATAPAGAFKCQDDYLFVVVMRQADFTKLCDAMDLPELRDDPRFASPRLRFDNMDIINRTVAARFAEAPAATWNERLTEAGLQNERVLTYPEFLRHPHVVETETISWLPQPGFDQPVPMPNVPGAERLQPGTDRAHSPDIGEHTKTLKSKRSWD